MSEPQHIGVCAILTNTLNQCTLGKRKNSYKAGMFGLPGGRVEVNEALTDAIQREVLEETGLTDLQFRFVGVVRENQGDYDFMHFVFTAQIGDQAPMLCEPDKCESWQWFEAKQLPETLPGHVAAIQLWSNNEKLADLVQQ